MRRLILALLSVFFALPSLAATNGDRFVRIDGGTVANGCRGTANVACGGGIPCANAPLCAFNAVDTALSGSATNCNGPCYGSAGDTVFVQPGTYSTSTLKPTGNGTIANPLTIVCDQSVTTGDCILNSIGADLIDNRGKSYITYRGVPTSGMFVFQQGKIHAWGTSSGVSSNGNIFDGIRTDDPDFLTPFAYFLGEGGGTVTSNTLKNSILWVPYYGTACSDPLPPKNGTCALQGPLYTGVNVVTAANETNTRITDSTIIGGRNTSTMTDSTGIVYDGVFLGGGQNHETDWCNGGSTGLGCVNITFKRGIFGPSGFHEPQPQTLGTITGMTLLNNAIISGWLMPSDTHDCDVHGTVQIANNVAFNQADSKTLALAGVNAGDAGAVCTGSVMTYDVNYNSYVMYKNATKNMFTESIDASNGTPNNTYTGNQFSSFLADPEISSRSIDTNSRLMLNKDIDSAQVSTGSFTATRMFGSTGPTWGGEIDCKFNTSPQAVDGSAFVPLLQAFGITTDWSGTLGPPALSPFHAGDFFIFGSDIPNGKMRQITSVSTLTTCGSSGKAGIRINFTPAIDWNGNGLYNTAVPGVSPDDRPQNGGANNDGGDWMFLYGQPDDNNDSIVDFTAGQAFNYATMWTFTPITGSALIDAGNPALCASTAFDGDGIGGAQCDIGPSEFVGVAPPNNNIELSVVSASIAEGTGGGNTSLIFTVNQNQTSSAVSTYNVTTSDGTALSASDYTAIANVPQTGVNIGALSTTFTVTLSKDALFENAENFTVTISNAANAEAGKTISITQATATGTIANDDVAPTLSVPNQTVAEGATATFTGTLSAAAGVSIDVVYATQDQTASSGGLNPDYVAASGTWTFAIGETVKTFTSSTIPDSISPEPTETALVNLTSTTSGVVPTTLPTLSITDVVVGSTIANLAIQGVHGTGIHWNGASVASTPLLQVGTITGTSLLTATAGTECPLLANYTQCRTFTVTSPYAVATATAVVWLGPKTAGSDLGIIVLHNGSRGLNKHAGTGLSLAWQQESASAEAMVVTLRGLGYAVMQLTWQSPGWLSDTGSADNATSFRLLASRNAAVYKYFYDNFSVPLNEPMCAVGNSGGADNLAHVLVDYGGATWFDAVLFTSGPVSGRVDLACAQQELDGDTGCESVYGWPTGTAKDLYDEGSGYAGGGTGPCYLGYPGPPTTAMTTFWRQNSIVYATGTCNDHGTFYYPNTYVGFMTGALDSNCAGCGLGAGNCPLTANRTNAPNHADLYHDELDNSNRGGATTCHATQTLISQDAALASANHTFHDTANAVTAIQNWIYTAGAPNHCKVQP